MKLLLRLLSFLRLRSYWRELSYGEVALVGDEFNSRGNGSDPAENNHLQAPSNAGGWVRECTDPRWSYEAEQFVLLRYRRLELGLVARLLKLWRN